MVRTVPLVGRSTCAVNEELGPTGNTALFRASRQGNVKKVQAYLKAGCLLETRSNGRTALHAACVLGRSICAMAILEAGADVNARDSNGSSALHLAAEAGYKYLVQVLLRWGATHDAKNHDGLTPAEHALQCWTQKPRRYSTISARRRSQIVSELEKAHLMKRTLLAILISRHSIGHDITKSMNELDPALGNIIPWLVKLCKRGLRGIVQKCLLYL